MSKLRDNIGVLPTKMLLEFVSEYERVCYIQDNSTLREHVKIWVSDNFMLGVLPFMLEVYRELYLRSDEILGVLG